MCKRDRTVYKISDAHVATGIRVFFMPGESKLDPPVCKYRTAACVVSIDTKLCQMFEKGLQARATEAT